jgi:membrane-associated phospholipid phosphatase
VRASHPEPSQARIELLFSETDPCWIASASNFEPRSEGNIMQPLRAALVLCICLAVTPAVTGQPTPTDQTAPAGDTAPPPPAPDTQSTSSPSVPGDRPVSWKKFLPNLLDDQKRIWTFPVRVAEGHELLPTSSVLGTTAALIAIDAHESAYFRRSSQFQGFNSIFTGNATSIGTVIAPVSLYAAGLIRKDSKMQHTALLAGEALADAEIVTTVLKDATGRVRPAAIPVKGNFSDSWFESQGSRLRGAGSFPSGHTIAAFSVATVIARRYGTHRWVPYAAYGMAALVGFSRLTLSAHFLSDVFMGGALGYSISRFTVLRQ